LAVLAAAGFLAGAGCGFGMSWYNAWTVPPGSWNTAYQPMFGISDFGVVTVPPAPSIRFSDVVR
jgi:hypothetical protein